MKQLLSNYGISGNVVTLTGVNRPREAILSITNATNGQILYTAQTAGATGYTQSANSTITLNTAPGNSSSLQIFYDDGINFGNANLRDGTGAAITSSTILGKQRLDVTLAAGTAPGVAAPAFMEVVGGTDSGGTGRAFRTDTTGNLGVNIVSSLPAGTNSIGTVLSNLRDGTGAAITSSTILGKQRLDVTLAGGVNSGSAAPAYMDMVGGADSGGIARALRTDSIGNLATIPGAGSVTNYSSSIATGGLAQTIVNANTINKFFVITNNSTSPMYLAIGTSGSSGNGLLISAGAGYEFPYIPSSYLSLYCATSGAVFAAYGA